MPRDPHLLAIAFSTISMSAADVGARSRGKLIFEVEGPGAHEFVRMAFRLLETEVETQNRISESGAPL